MSSNTPITRQVMPPLEVKLDAPENSMVTQQINNQTWRNRFLAMQRPEGYHTGKRVLRMTPINEWLAPFKSPETSPMWFIDGTFLFLAIQTLSLYVDYTKLAESRFFRAPINYFATFIRENDNVYRLFARMQDCGYSLTTREVTRMEPIDLETFKPQEWPVEETIHWIEQRNNKLEQNFNNSSVVPEMVVRILKCVYDLEKPDLDHVLLITNNTQMIPLITELKSMGVTVTLGVIRNRSVSNYFLQQVHHIIDMEDLLKSCGALTQNYRTRS
jgi:hypothetical protein